MIDCPLTENRLQSMIYACLSAMERKGWIKCVKNRNGRAYSLTEQGQETVKNLPNIADEIQQSVKKLLKS